jgi:hypothetical protein
MGTKLQTIDHLPYTGSWKKSMQEKEGLVWAFAF